MTSALHTLLAYDGSSIDGGLYSTVTGWAAAAPHWLDQLIKAWSDYGLGLFAVFMLWAWWQARRADSVVMARVLASPLVVVAVYLVNSVLKSLVEEVRPCQQLPTTVTLETCPAPGDWSFPSNHSVIAFSAAVALCLAYRRLGAVALLAAALMAASRVWVGVHYPHDVVVGALIGVLVAFPLALLAGRAAPMVERLRGGALGAALGSG
ncbi:phosphatase PAP2 family protein [Kitasatospora sp. NBC_01287]|uniref:phosphatase PAP2 family protein n=1 Tax=Kitasatospora sp. NBC_01287 TaxID=2903573 RepID=UPI002258ACFC|nr:phosphatase PAP2 family protein [Kitasatospora sp. NBC_01287]MCX4746198.1 phosphatase PAP2 family protein [Kitasatospora sp. NBC_01287]